MQRLINCVLDIINNINYQSDYTAGLRVYDVSSIPENPRGDDVCESKLYRQKWNCTTLTRLSCFF